MEDCIFCKIIRKEIPTELVYEDEKVIAFNDIQPEAPVHILIVPKEHIPTLNDIGPEQKNLMGHILWTIKEIARMKNLQKSGYRIITNCGTGAGQVVFHLHFHLLGGKRFE